MKKLLFVLISLVFNQLATAQDMYLEYKISGPVLSQSKMYTSAAGVRLEADVDLPQLGKQHSVTLMPTNKPNTTIILNEATKTYTETTTNQAEMDKLKYTVKVIGKERVGAYTCIHSIIGMGQSGEMDIWTTKEIPGYESLLKTTLKQSGGDNMYKELIRQGADGMMVKYLIKRGEKPLMMELVKVEKRNNPASLFAIPSDYKKGVSFDPSQMERMSPAERQKAVQEMMKQYGGKLP